MSVNAISGQTLNIRNFVDKAEHASAQARLRLSTGLRINDASDDAAGLSISSRMKVQISGNVMALRNAHDLISLTQTAASAAKDVNDALQHMRELCVQAANGTLTSADRISINAEISQLKQHIDEISRQAKFNKINLLDGSFKDRSFQLDSNAQYTLKLSAPALDTSSLGSTALIPQVSINQGVQAADAIPGKSSLAFVNIKNLSKGDWIEINGLKFFCTENMPDKSTIYTPSPQTYDNYVASSIFQGLKSNNSTPNLGWWNGINLSQYGYFSGELTDWDGSGQGPTVTYDGSTNLDFRANFIGAYFVGTVQTVRGVSLALLTTHLFQKTPSLRIDASSSGLISITHEQQGASPVPAIAPVTESANITFTAMTKGQSVTVAELKFTANQDLTASQVAAAFENLVSNSNQGSSTFGTYSGKLKGYSSSAAINNTVTMTSTTAGSQVPDIVVKASAGLDGISVATQQDAVDGIKVIDNGIEVISKFQSELGTVLNRVESVIDNLTNSSTSLNTSFSRIIDADYATETANLARNLIISQCAVAMLSQANHSTTTVQYLLRQFK